MTKHEIAPREITAPPAPQPAPDSGPQYLVLQPLERIDGAGIHTAGAIIATDDLLPESITILEELAIIRVATRQDVRQAAADALALATPNP